MTATNPFFEISLLPYQAPHFDQINDSHYRPAFDEALRQKRADIDAIVSQTAAPDFNNTVLALEKSGVMLSRVSSVFFAMTSVHTNPYLQELEEQFSTELAALANDIWLNDTLFARVESVWQDRGALDAESRRLVEETYQRFILAGARLNETEKAELKALNTEAASLTSQFNQRLLSADKAGGLVVDYAHQLEGLSAEEIAAAAQAAAEKGLNDRWLISLLNTTQQPALSALRNRQTRENLFNAGWTRTQKGDENDTRTLILRLTALRARQARLLGFEDYASWSIADQMAKTPDAALAFMRGIVPAARARAEREQADIQKVIDDEQGGFTVQAWDWAFYAERVRQAKYALDESQIRPYFALTNSSKDAWFSGYGPGVVTSVWIGFDDHRRDLGRTTASGAIKDQISGYEGGAKSAQPTVAPDSSLMAVIAAPSISSKARSQPRRRCMRWVQRLLITAKRTSCSKHKNAR